MKLLTLALIIFSLSSKAQQNIVDFEVNKDSEISILLTFETINILDSISEKIWPGWSAKNLTYFIGANEGNLILVNPFFPIPDGYKKYDKISKRKNIVYIREESNFTKVFGATNYVVLDGKFYYTSTMHRYPIPWQSDSFITGKIATAFNPFPDEYNKRIVNLCRSLEYYMSVQIHEGFHVYQRPKSLQLQKSTIKPAYYFKPKIMVYSYIEGMLLMNALNTDDKEEFLEIIHKFITVRNEKNKLLSGRQARAEQEDEFLEGTAQYVQTASQAMLQKLKYEPQVSSLKFLGCDFSNAQDFQLHDSLSFIAAIRQYNIDSFWSKQYYYGQAQAYILDKLCGNIWKSELMEGKTLLWDLILRYSEYNKLNKQNINNIKKEYQFEHLLNKVKNMNKKLGNGILM